MPIDSLILAKKTLSPYTPLVNDCGALCGRACCKGTATDGMTLFPGEETIIEGYQHKIIQANNHSLLVCGGTCDRERRPLSCMIFPLIITINDDIVRLEKDRRAFAICPLATRGIRSLSPSFIGAARRAARILASDDEIREFIERMTQEHERLKTFEGMMGDGETCHGNTTGG